MDFFDPVKVMEYRAGANHLDTARGVCINFFSERLADNATLIPIPGTEGTYKIETRSEGNAEVRYFDIDFIFNSSVLDTNIAQIKYQLTTAATNEELMKLIMLRIEINRNLHLALENIDIQDLFGNEEEISLRDLFNLIGRSITLNDLGQVFGNRKVTRKLIQDIKDGTFHCPISIVYKRLQGENTENAQVKDALIREVNIYEIYDMNDFHTFCALKVVARDTEYGFYDYTLQDKEMTLFIAEENLFSEELNIFSSFMSELARLHLSDLTHGDLHFKNVGYKLGQDGQIIVIFDLMRATIASQGIQERIKFDLLIFSNSLFASLQEAISAEPPLSEEDRRYVLEALNKYFESLGVINGNSSSKITDSSIKDYILDIFSKSIELLRN